MTLGELPSSGIYIDIALGLVVLLVLFYQMAAQQRARKKIGELEKRIAAAEEVQAAVFANLEKKDNALKEIVFEKTKPMTNKLNEFSKKASIMLEKNEAVRRELEDQIGPLRSSIDETAAIFNSSQDAIRKVVQDGKNEIERMTKEVEGFKEEIKKVKDFIRDGIIDVEL
jgi:predicted  nucleic acid-binding Zn-ribbon protein